MKRTILLLALACGALSAPVEDDASQEFITGNHQFSAGVYKEISKYEHENFIVSPLSAQTILALVHEGARGETAKEFVTGLYLPSTEQKIQYAFKSFLPKLRKSDKHLKFLSANKIYVGEQFQLADDFKDIAISVYDSGVENIDFAISDQAAETINKWVENRTNDKIQNLVNPKTLGEGTKIILVNTLYFNGNWRHKFYPENTKSRNFYQSPDKAVEIPTMSQVQNFNYGDNPTLKAQFLKLPYEGENVNMIIALPYEGEDISSLEQNMEQVLQFQQFSSENIDVELPKFKTESDIKFVPILKNLGMKTAFSGDDFSGISSSDKNLVINDVLQKAYISVDENGTEAAAATATLVGSSFDPSQPISFKANRPFIYYITIDEVVAFTGKVSNFGHYGQEE